MGKVSFGKGACLVVCLVSLVLAIAPAQAYVIDTSKTGGDCTKFGTWNSKTKTCTLNRDIFAEESSVPYYVQSGYVVFGSVILIKASGVTLDGNGHTLQKSAVMDEQPNVGIRIGGFNNVTIKNLTVRGFTQAWGLHVEGTVRKPVSYLKVSGSTFQDCYTGIQAVRLASSVLEGNTFGTAEQWDPTYPYGAVPTYAMRLDYATAIYVRSNIFDVFGSQVLGDVAGGELSGNTFSGGLVGWYGDANLIADNMFVGSAAHAYGEVSVWSMGQGSILRDNTFDYYWVRLLGRGENVMTHNNFISRYYSFGDPRNPYPVPVLLPNLQVLTEVPNTLSLPLPVGGNYYNFFDHATEGCADEDDNGVCDASISFGGNDYAISIDAFPYTLMNGWLP